MSLLYDPDLDAGKIRDDHARLTSNWHSQPAPTVAPDLRHRNRPLRVGYLTGDFYGNHPVAQFMAPVTPHHTAMNVEAFAYLNHVDQDAVTARFSEDCALRSIYGLDDASAARRIEEDRLDLLIDLSGHSSQNRLRVLGYRPAPVQACFVGYPSTTGFDAVDYLIADVKLVPPEHEGHYTELIARLPDSFLCFQPRNDMPDPMLKPERQGGVVLGTLNHMPKLNAAVIQAWSEILNQVPEATLLYKCAAFSEPETREAVAHRFESHGISRQRLLLQGPSPFAEAMSVYRDIDLALDPFPYGGGHHHVPSALDGDAGRDP